MFWRRKPKPHQGPLLFAVMECHPQIREELTAEALVHALNRFLRACEAAVSGSGGTVLRFVGTCSVAAWALEPGPRAPDPIRTGWQVLHAVRAALASEDGGPNLPMAIRVGLVKGDCVYSTKGREISGVMGHAWLRALELRLPMDPSSDALIVDVSVRGDAGAHALQDLGGNAFRVVEPTP